MFPEKNDFFWVDLLKKKPRVHSFALGILLSRLQKDFENNNISEQEAVDKIIDFFNKYKVLCKKEMQLIQSQL